MSCALFSLAAFIRAVHSEEGEGGDESLCFVFSYPVTWSACRPMLPPVVFFLARI